MTVDLDGKITGTPDNPSHATPWVNATVMESPQGQA